MMNTLFGLNFPRLTFLRRWKGAIALVYVISLGLVQVVGESDGAVSSVLVFSTIIMWT